eukprot:CAMPEP_0175985498 /NCGR_PEP_ID=MMETSP0108-20121206/49598_1 /TAXON_ID=195067 ORGANISM="Goniomonas pacifica, Strain CCMP1869" /NCGR_SAMPLE_ID=MMETSP0108 /ASSEMBLY_ACC=CAM_ASM_000204 /LENGTH=160 /DNA_ID=CAMNT_0017316493 /DNA_START=475 /DNA_END=957 /DNA_ORIENTATION=+
MARCGNSRTQKEAFNCLETHRPQTHVSCRESLRQVEAKMGIIVLGGDPLEEEESEETDIDDVSNDDGDFAFFVSAAVFTIIIMSIVGIGAALAVRKYWRRRTERVGYELVSKDDIVMGIPIDGDSVHDADLIEGVLLNHPNLTSRNVPAPTSPDLKTEDL